MTSRKERKKKIQLRLWDSNPQPLAYMDKGTTTCAKGEPEVVGRGSGLYPAIVIDTRIGNTVTFIIDTPCRHY